MDARSDAFAPRIGATQNMLWVIARTQAEVPLFATSLAVPQETSTALSGRWEAESHRRFAPGCDNRLVVALGSADLVAGLSLARSRLNLANILDTARSQQIEVFVVGPPPRPDVDPAALASLSDAYADVTTRRQARYVETYAPLRTHDQWLADVAAGDGVRPGQAGYGLLAWLVLHNGWHDWLGLPNPA